MEDRKRLETLLDDVAHRLGEHVADYLIVVRPSPRGISWRSSDCTWGMGAAERYVQAVRVGDNLDQAEDFRHGGG